jgi:hypothetical protein
MAAASKIREKAEWERKRALEHARLTVLFQGFDDAGMRRLWDAYDGANHPMGYSGEDIHAELNRRGDGTYCAV